jgi:hypothetical protein
MVETKGQSQTNTPGATAAATSTNYTDWTKIAPYPAAGATTTLFDSATPTSGSVDGTIGSLNNGFVNMDGRVQLTTTTYTKSYYATILARSGATVVDQGVYTLTFTLTDANGNVRGTQTVKIDFVSAKSKSDAKLSIATSGTFIANAALVTTNATGAAYATVTLTNRDGGAIRSSNGGVESPTVTIQDLALTPVADTMTVVVNDWGVSGADFGENTTNKNLIPQNGVYGVKVANLPSIATSLAQTYQFYALYGNATPATAALTLFDATSTATNTNTDAIVTAAGMSAADSLAIVNDADASYEWTLPTTTKTATIKFAIQNSSDTAVAAADVTVTPTWSGTFGSAAVTPATSTTGTVYTTDANGNITVTVTNSAPVDTAKVTLVLTGGKVFGTTKYTAAITWAAPVAKTIAVADPITGVYVKTGSTNVTTVIVKDQFGAPVAGEVVKVALSSTSANYSATTTISPITTGANGTATYSLVGGATTATSDAITFTATSSTVSPATASMTYNYVTTIPEVATLAGFYDQTWTTSTPSTAVPTTGIYSSGTTKLTLVKSLNLSKNLSAVSDSATDALVGFRFYGLTSAAAAATGAVVTVTASAGGHILDASGLPVSSRNFLIASTGYTPLIQVLATGTGAITITATSTVSSSAVLHVANAAGDARFVTLTQAAANGPVVAKVTDRFGNGIAGLNVQIGVSAGTLGNGQLTSVYATDLTGSVAVLPTGSEPATITATLTDTTANDVASVASYSGTTLIDSSVAAGNKTASITFTPATPAQDVAQAAADAAAEATDAANAATDAANAAAEAADAAPAAAQDSADAVAALSTQVSEMISALKKQITALTNLVIKIQKKVRA